MADKRKRECYFSKNNIEYIDFADVGLLRKFLTPAGKILPRRITGVTAYWQRKLSSAVKQARQSGLLAPTLTK